jgi:predicted nucleotidyltransferase
MTASDHVRASVGASSTHARPPAPTVVENELRIVCKAPDRVPKRSVSDRWVRANNQHASGDAGDQLGSHMDAVAAHRLINFIASVVGQRSDLRGAAVCGSWARGSARPESDLDILLIARQPEQLRRNQEWICELRFSDAGLRYVDHTTATYGVVWSAHVNLEPEAQLELCIASEAWASVSPIDAGTLQVITGGFKIVVDKDGLLERLICSI